ncbi:MAG: hypothetical protein ABSF95_17030 [Verrucomicrobiota bacterium]|jgi:hypothetical protein
MTKKHWLLMALITLAGGLGLYCNRDWFANPPIQISHRFHAFAARFTDGAGSVPLLFEFNRKLKLTSIQVVPVTDIQTNKYPHPLWALVSDSNSVPTKGFLYGMNVPGMRPAYQGVAADPPYLGVKYRLLIKAGSLKAQHDFVLEPPAL